MVDAPETTLVSGPLEDWVTNVSMVEDGEGKVAQPTTTFTVPISKQTLLAIGVYLTVVGVTSTLGNSMFVMVLRRRLRVMNDGQTVLLMSAALCDLSITLTGYPYTTISAFWGEWIFGDVICKMYGFLCFTLNEVQMNTLVVIAIFRYISICRPQFNHLLTPELARKCLLVVWAYCLVWTVAPLVGWSRYTREPFEVSCSTDWHDRSVSGIIYSFSLVVFCFVVQLLALVICYYKILMKSRQLRLRWPETNPKLFVNDEEDVNISEGIKCCKYYVCVCESNFKNGVEKHVLWVNMVMVLSFTIFWTPYSVISILSVFKKDLNAFWYVFPTVFAKTSCMMNPIIYGLSHKLLQREFFAFLKTCCCCYRDVNTRTEQQNLRRRMQEGTYDKEGIYVGKVRVGLCACNGCVVGRRETLHAQMTVMARLQKNSTETINNDDQPSGDKGGKTCAITLVDETHILNRSSNSSFRQGNQHEAAIITRNTNSSNALVDPKGWSCTIGQQEVEQESSFNGQGSKDESGSRHKKSSKEDMEQENSLQIFVTTHTTTNTSRTNDSASPDDSTKGAKEGTTIHTASTLTTNDTITEATK